jgi:hypothetical protein
MHHPGMRISFLAACALLTVALPGAPLAQTTSPGSEQPPVTAPTAVPRVITPIAPVRPPLGNITIQRTIRTSALTMVGGAVTTTTATPRNIRTTRLAMVGGVLATSSVAPRNIRTTALTMRGAP